MLNNFHMAKPLFMRNLDSNHIITLIIHALFIVNYMEILIWYNFASGNILFPAVNKAD